MSGEAAPAPWKEDLLSYEEVFLSGKTPTPSQVEGQALLSTELSYRFLGCHLIQRAGRLLKMPQTGLMTGQILLQKFYCQCPLTKYPLLEVAMACILIASKVEECSRRVRDIVNIFHWLWSSIRNRLPYRMMEYVGEEYYKWRDRVTSLELVILRELGFHVQPDQPVGLLINYLNALEMSSDVRVAQRALNYLNDGLRTVVYLCYPPPVIACAAISLAADDFAVEMPEGEPHWWIVFDVHNLEQLQQAKNIIRSAYSYKVDFTGVPLTREEMGDNHNNEEVWEVKIKKPKELSPSQSRAREGDSDKSPDHHRRGERSQDRARDEPYEQHRGRSRDLRRHSRSRSGSRPRSRFGYRSRSVERSHRHHSHRRASKDRDYSGEHRRSHYRHRPRSRTRSRSRSKSRSRSVDDRRASRSRSGSRDRQGRSPR